MREIIKFPKVAPSFEAFVGLGCRVGIGSAQGVGLEFFFGGVGEVTRWKGEAAASSIKKYTRQCM